MFFVEKEKEAVIDGSFELLNNDSRSIKPIDIREFARNLVEITGDPEDDMQRYLQAIPKVDRDQIESDQYQLNKFKKQFEKRDIQLYQNRDVW